MVDEKDGATPNSEPGDEALAAWDQRTRNIVREELGTFVDERLKPILEPITAAIRELDSAAIAKRAVELFRTEQVAAASQASEALSRAPDTVAEEAPAGNMTEMVKTALRQDPAGTITTLLDTLFDKYLKFEDARTKRDNPFSWARTLAEGQPEVAGYIGSLLSPDPVSGQIPLMLGQASTKAFDAGFKAGQVALRQTTGGGRADPNPFGSESESTERESPGSDAPREHSVEETASMTGDRGQPSAATKPASETPKRALFSIMADR